MREFICNNADFRTPSLKILATLHHGLRPAEIAAKLNSSIMYFPQYLIN